MDCTRCNIISRYKESVYYRIVFVQVQGGLLLFDLHKQVLVAAALQLKLHSIQLFYSNTNIQYYRSSSQSIRIDDDGRCNMQISILVYAFGN